MKVVTFGELLLRLTSPGYTRLFQKDTFDLSFCGAEANVATSLAIFGVDSVFISKLPNSDVGRAAAHYLDYFNVDTSNVIYGDGRMGLYYLEKGASQRPSKVIYDRLLSSFSLAARSEFDWKSIFAGADWFHWSGINPAISDEMSLICRDACEVAQSMGITISCDLNYRSALWDPNKAQTVIKPLMKYVNICICNEEDATKMLGITPKHSNVYTGELDHKDYTHIAKVICDTYGCTYVATTLRKSYSASNNGWAAMLFDADSSVSFFSTEYEIQLVDRVGGGDSFSAGLIYAILSGMNGNEAINFATAASCLKQTIEGDFNRSSVDDVNSLLKDGGTGRVNR